MGAVYEALHRETKRRRAIKLLLPVLVSDPDARARFAQEATITADIESEHLVETFDAGIDPVTGCPFIVMELLRGESLGERLAHGRRLTAPQAIEVLRQVARVLEKTHAAGVIHRDLKPDNLFLCTREDGSVRIKVLDFGIAKIVQHASKSRNTVNIGTPLYMAPEQLDGGKLDRRADVYSLGHVGYELLTGESYWEAELRRAPSTLVLLKWMEGPMPEAPSVRAARRGVVVGPEFDAWFLRATARHPEARFQRASDLVEAFAAAVGMGHVALANAEPLSLPRPSLPSFTETTTQTMLGVGQPSSRVTADTDAPTRVRQMPFDEIGAAAAPAYATPAATSARSVPVALIAVSGAAAFLAMGALALALGSTRSGEPNGSAAAGEQPAAEAAKPAETAVAPPVVSAQEVEVVASNEPSAKAAPSASASAKPKTARTDPARTSRPDDRCKREPERCR
jgi:serine/threonine-protein kinase